jgi:acetate kinase
MILVLNCGSQSIKWKLYDRGLKLKSEGMREVFDVSNYKKLLEEELRGLVKFKNDIKKIGHRVVNGGESFLKPVKINEKVLGELRDAIKIAPLHNPYNILGIETAIKLFEKSEQIAVFDTEFFAKISGKANMYPLPENIREKFKFQRFGFHGISHEYASKEAAKTIGKPYNKLKIISCHLGGGSSIAMIKNGRAIDTTMGFSPMEGLMMVTRSGSIDPQIILDLASEYGIEKASHILNKESGVYGISGQKDMLGVIKKARKGDKKSKLALEMFSYSVKKYIGAGIAVLDGCDLLVFTGTIGAGEKITRNLICSKMNFLKNTKVIVVKADEELEIAKKVEKCKGNTAGSP